MMQVTDEEFSLLMEAVEELYVGHEEEPNIRTSRMALKRKMYQEARERGRIRSQKERESRFLLARY